MTHALKRAGERTAGIGPVWLAARVSAVYQARKHA